jgi:acyl carrier protein phosphodiesterase
VNFLAHAYLSFGDQDVLLGNLIADFVKGKQIDTYSDSVKNGIYLHRAIDHFTDNHVLVREAQDFLRPNYLRYSTVITDMYFDHFLAKYWSNYHELPLKQFSKNTYQILRLNQDILPEKFLNALAYMEKEDWLSSYATSSGIQRALTNMSKRARFISHMEHAHQTLEAYEEYFRGIFVVFFKDLIEFSEIKFKKL